MTQKQPDWPVERRHFVAIASSTFEDRHFPDLKGVPAEVDAIRAWLCDPNLGERHFEDVQPQLAQNPTPDEVRDGLAVPGSGEWTASDAAVVFVTTHGWIADDEHWLAFEQTDRAKREKTALRTRALVGVLRDSGIRHLLLVIDACYAGQIAGAIAAFDKDLPKEWLVLPGATKNQKSEVGALSGAITKLLAELAMREGEKYGRERYIKVEDFIEGLEKALSPRQLVRPLSGNQVSGPHVCLPNPHYQPSVTAPTSATRRDLALLQTDVDAHWGPRSRGIPNAKETGWLFSGRDALMRRLIDFTQGQPGVLLVTGGAGSGKSAVLARLVTLSDPTFRATYPTQVATIPPDLLPPEDAVDVAVLATGKNALEILTQVCGAVGATDTPAATLEAAKKEWTALIVDRTQRLTIVVDALDEATNPGEVVQQALLPLVGEHHKLPVRLLVGVRSAGGTAHSASPREGLNRQLIERLQTTLAADPETDRVPVDEAPWWVPDDLERYVTSVLLLTEHSPYDGHPEAAESVATVLAAAAGTSFLVARMAASALASRTDMVDPNDPAWRHAVSNGVLGVFRDDLLRTLPAAYDRERAVHLLRAVAFAYGRGLPWAHLWPLVANAVADEPGRYGDTDIAWLLSTRLGGYLVTDREDGVTVYRLFHDDLRTNLRERWRELLDIPPADTDA